MPSSKRARVVPTSKTRKNHKELVRKLAANIQAAAEEYNSIFVFDVDNMRNTSIKQVRAEFADSRIFMGKTKVMMVALGRNKETEAVPGVSDLQRYVKGEVGLLFTNRPAEEVQEYFGAFVNLDFARSGAVAPQAFRIPPGELYTAFGVEGGAEDPLPMSIEPTLRKLGVPTRIVKGKVTLEQSAADSMVDDEGYLVCKEGDTLDSRQTSILKIFGVRMSEFKMGLKAVYDKESASVKELGGMEVDEAAA